MRCYYFWKNQYFSICFASIKFALELESEVNETNFESGLRFQVKLLCKQNDFPKRFEIWVHAKSHVNVLLE